MKAPNLKKWYNCINQALNPVFFIYIVTCRYFKNIMENAKGKIDELLSKRESLKSQIRNVNRLIKDGIKYTKDFPERWYVENPQKNVIEYLNEKFNKDLEIKMIIDDYKGCGFGVLHGEYAFIPAAVEYSWRITPEEFNLCLSVSNGR